MVNLDPFEKLFVLKIIDLLNLIGKMKLSYVNFVGISDSYV